MYNSLNNSMNITKFLYLFCKQLPQSYIITYIDISTFLYITIAELSQKNFYSPLSLPICNPKWMKYLPNTHHRVCTCRTRSVINPRRVSWRRRLARNFILRRPSSILYTDFQITVRFKMTLRSFLLHYDFPCRSENLIVDDHHHS